MRLPKLLARNSLYDCSNGEDRVDMVVSQILVLRKSCDLWEVFIYKGFYLLCLRLHNSIKSEVKVWLIQLEQLRKLGYKLVSKFFCRRHM